MEQIQGATQGLMDAWMTSGGVIMASNAVKTMNDSALSAAAVTANTGGDCRMEVEPNDAVLNAAASTSVSFGCPVF
ncbi:hypothetical protein [Thalassospira sp.]|uniref:hypothetical protein n=1 Tax=Thalassospira sp. TaxID=1912094 RepID=UPI003AA8B47C